MAQRMRASVTAGLRRVGPWAVAALVAAGCASGPALTPNDRPAARPAPAAEPQAVPSPPPAGQTGRRPGGYYLDDGPGANPPADLQAIPDAVPRAEPVKASTTRPYAVFGRNYTPMTSLAPYKARGVASWYGRRYHGKPTSSGEIYDMYGMTAAHTTLPIPSYVRVTSVSTRRSVVVRVNDRGPFHSDRLIDLSYAAAWKLGLVDGGSGVVDVEVIIPAEGKEALPARVEAAAEPRPLPVHEVTSPAAPLATDGSGVFLQFGAFGTRGSAEDFLGKMRVELDGLEEPLLIFASESLFRVQAGPFADRKTARREAARVVDRLGLRPVVVVR